MTIHDPDLEEAGGCHPLFRGRPVVGRIQQAAQAPASADRARRSTISPWSRPGERWLVALSGGKDSYGLLATPARSEMARAAAGRPLRLQPRPGPAELSEARPAGFSDAASASPHRIEYQDTYSVVTDKIAEGNTYCSLCSRLRRGHLYRIAREEGCSSLVLGHHREDILETFFMNLFHGGRLAAMPPKLLNDEGDVMVLRPLALLREADLRQIRRPHALPDHPLRSLRQPGRPAAQCHEGDARRYRAAHARPQGHHDPRARQCQAFASARPQAVRFAALR